MRYLPLRKSAFTLMELLISITIVSILIAIVAMTASGIRQSSSVAKCASNLRQLAIGYNSYLNDRGGIFPSRFWSRASPDGILDYAGISSQNILEDTIFTCPALQQTRELKSVDLLHRNYGINLYATTEKAAEGFNTRLANVSPSQMMLITEGRVLNPLTDANGNQGQQYQTSTRSTHMVDQGGWNYPHSGHQNVLFMDGRVERINRQTAVKIGSDKLFWNGHK